MSRHARLAALLASLGVAMVARTDAARARPHANPFGLDGEGRLMLDPVRWEALRPAALVARLGLRPDAVVADVGAGPGFLTLPLAEAVPSGKVIATDARPSYLAVAAARASAIGLTNVETRAVGVDAPGLPRSSVDLAVLCQVDHYLHDRTSYFSALIPALRPDGRIALVNYARYRDADLAAARAAGLQVVDEWKPTPPFFLLVLARLPGGAAGGIRR